MIVSVFTATLIKKGFYAYDISHVFRWSPGYTIMIQAIYILPPNSLVVVA